MFLGCHSICRGAHVVFELEIDLWHNVAHRGTSLDCHESFSQLSWVHQTATGLEWNKTGGYRWCLRTCVLVRRFGRPETEEITHQSPHSSSVCRFLGFWIPTFPCLRWLPWCRTALSMLASAWVNDDTRRLYMFL